MSLIDKPPVAKPKKRFWDIEAYENLFLVVINKWIDGVRHREVHYLVTNKTDADAVKRACDDYGDPYTIYNLAVDSETLIRHFKRQIPNMGKDSLLGQFLGIKDKEVKPKEYHYYSFNGLGYDIQMMMFFESTVVAGRTQTTPIKMRRHSDAIINGDVRKLPTLPYEQYANQVDCAHLNESMIESGKITMGLKTLVGMLGGSIIESESNKSGVSKDIYGDVLYCFNDTTELEDVVYQGTKIEITETVRSELLESYKDRLGKNGVTRNSTSAKFVENIIAPDEPIDDLPYVDYTYPATHIADEHDIKQFDMLEYTKNWYMTNVYNVVKKHNPSVAEGHLVKFMSIYKMYSEVKGKNWNSSARHVLRYNVQTMEKSKRRELYDTYGTYLPLIDKYGNNTGTYVNFSLGGIHGAEIHMKQLRKDREKIKYLREKYRYISNIPQGEVSQSLKNLIIKQSRTCYGDFPQYLAHEIPYFYKNTVEVDEILHESQFTPFMYQPSSKKKQEELLGRYRYTSTGHVIHQDFAGYYPMLLINLGAFHNGEGTDPYREVYDRRIAIKKTLKKLMYKSKEWLEANIKQEGYKLVLNSASGGLDANHDTKIRANNKAMIMRIIGQLMTWIIAQATALEGAKVPSSNTDGIYVSGISEELNKTIIDKELKPLLVTIDPEPLFLVSKDTNTRAEIVKGEVTSARGSGLTSSNGPTVEKRLSHPALVDAALVNYLQNEDIVNKPVDRNLILKAIMDYHNSVDMKTFMLMSSWVMRPTAGSVFVADDKTVYKGTIRTWMTRQGQLLERYTPRSVKPSNTLDGYADDLREDDLLGEPQVVAKLKRLGVIDHFKTCVTVNTYSQLPDKGLPNKDRTSPSVVALSQVKVSNLPDMAKVHIDNSSLLAKTEDELRDVYMDLDVNAYVDMVTSFAEQWVNTLKPS